MISITKYGAEWCQPCRKYDPILDRVGAQRDDVVITKLDIEKDNILDTGFTGVPYTVFRDAGTGEVLGTYQGAMSQYQLNKVIDALREEWPQDQTSV